MDNQERKIEVIIDSLKSSLERDENVLKYQEEELRQLKERVSAMESELNRSREVVRLTKEILKEYEDA